MSRLKEKSGRFSAVSRGKYNILGVYNIFPDEKRPSESFTISFRKNKAILRVRFGREHPRVESVPGCIAHDVVASLSLAQSNTLCLSQLDANGPVACGCKSMQLPAPNISAKVIVSFRYATGLLLIELCIQPNPCQPGCEKKFAAGVVGVYRVAQK